MLQCTQELVVRELAHQPRKFVFIFAEKSSLSDKLWAANSRLWCYLERMPAFPKRPSLKVIHPRVTTSFLLLFYQNEPEVNIQISSIELGLLYTLLPNFDFSSRLPFIFTQIHQRVSKWQPRRPKSPRPRSRSVSRLQTARYYHPTKNQAPLEPRCHLRIESQALLNLLSFTEQQLKSMSVRSIVWSLQRPWWLLQWVSFYQHVDHN